VLLLLNSFAFIYIPADFNLFDVLHEIYIFTILHTNCYYNFAEGCGCGSSLHGYMYVCVPYQGIWVKSIVWRRFLVVFEGAGLSKLAVLRKCPCTLPNLHRTPLESHPLSVMPGYLFVSERNSVYASRAPPVTGKPKKLLQGTLFR